MTTTMDSATAADRRSCCSSALFWFRLLSCERSSLRVRATCLTVAILAAGSLAIYGCGSGTPLHRQVVGNARASVPAPNFGSAGQSYPDGAGGTVRLTFGMKLDYVQQVTGRQPYVDSLYLPSGIVKGIHPSVDLPALKFVSGNLQEIEYGKGFNFELGVSPYRNDLYNPPGTLRRRMNRSDMETIIRTWEHRLSVAGLQKTSKRDQMTAGNYWTEYGDWLVGATVWHLAIGACSSQPQTRCARPRVSWRFVFRDDRLEEMVADDQLLDRAWSPTRGQ